MRRKTAPTILAALAILVAAFLPSCATTPDLSLDKRHIIEKFKQETGLHILEEVRAVEFFQNEIPPGISIVKYAVFLSENDANSVLAQKPPFSSEWTKGDFYADYGGEWINSQRLKLDPYAGAFRDFGAPARPVSLKGYVSRTGSLQSGDKTLKVLFLDHDNHAIFYYVMKNN